MMLREQIASDSVVSSIMSVSLKFTVKTLLYIRWEEEPTMAGYGSSISVGYTEVIRQ